MKYYAGIGSRNTPCMAGSFMGEIAVHMNAMGYTLRSGGADGADTFFEQSAKRAEIFLPWKGFNKRPPFNLHNPDGHIKYFESPTDEAIALAEEQIDGYMDRDQPARMLLARNMHQVLGEDLMTPAEFVVCWTRNAAVSGGTAHAIRLAKSRGILVFNLASDRDEELLLKRTGMDNQQVMF